MDDKEKYGRVFAVRLQPDLAREFEYCMRRSNYTINEMLVEMIKFYMEEHERERPLFALDLQNF